ncbi:MAG: copper amine oxidase N-terminal domain-containing protein [Clostridia bacterium]|nr:copper amine oxidase N-terminal domain-containing protein [Clostridia bacterium]
MSGRRKQLFIAVAVIATLSVATVALAASPIRLLVNGGEIRPDVPPQIINGRTMVPVRWVAEALGFDVTWNPGKKQVEVIHV